MVGSVNLTSLRRPSDFYSGIRFANFHEYQLTDYCRSLTGRIVSKLSAVAGSYSAQGWRECATRRSMFQLEMFVSDRRPANLLAQIRWRDGVYSPRHRAESVIEYGSYRVFHRYRCKNCDRTFSDQTGTVCEHSLVELRKWFLAVYTYICFNTIFPQ